MPYRPYTSRRRLPPCPLVIVLVPLKCSSTTIFSHGAPLLKGNALTPLPFKKTEAYRHRVSFYSNHIQIMCCIKFIATRGNKTHHYTNQNNMVSIRQSCSIEIGERRLKILSFEFVHVRIKFISSMSILLFKKNLGGGKWKKLHIGAKNAGESCNFYKLWRLASNKGNCIVPSIFLWAYSGSHNSCL